MKTEICKNTVMFATVEILFEDCCCFKDFSKIFYDLSPETLLEIEELIKSKNEGNKSKMTLVQVVK
jgi:hypothetical protein